MSRAGYRYLEDIAISDVAFEAWGTDLETLFIEAAHALTNCMIHNLDEIQLRETRPFSTSADALDLLLFRFLQELIYFKDAERLVFSQYSLTIRKKVLPFEVSGNIIGETIDTARHHLGVDVKAVTLHQFELIRTIRGWRTQIILDI